MNTESNSQLWHNRLGHLSYDGLSTLASKQMVIGLPQITAPQEACTQCLGAKQHRHSMSREGVGRAFKKLQLVHAYLCGPINPTSSSNKRYFVSFIEDLTRKTWLYFLNQKSETFSLFKNFKALVEKEVGEIIICLRTDRGGEFCSREFEEFCRNQGIRRQLTTTYTPQQNGVAERKNRTIMNMVRTMLIGRQVPKIFWPEATKWCAHILNRSPTYAVQDHIPEEAWSGIKPFVDYFRVFSCLAYVHTPDQHRSKLDNKSKPCILFGVSDESKAYRFFDPTNKKIIISKDVIFEENKGWIWEQSGVENHLEIVVEESSDSQSEPKEEQPESQVVRNDSHTPTLEIPAEGKAKRNRRKPIWMTDYEEWGNIYNDSNISAMLAAETDPVTFEEAIKSKKWQEAKGKEMKVIEKNQTWELAHALKDVKPIRVKWIYKTKLKENGEVEKFKVRLVANAYA